MGRAASDRRGRLPRRSRARRRTPRTRCAPASRRSRGSRCSAGSHATIVAYAALGDDMFAVADRLEARGWTVDRQHRPDVDPSHGHRESRADRRALSRRSARVRSPRYAPSPKLAKAGTAPMYGMAASMPVRRLVASKGATDRQDDTTGSYRVKRIAFARIAQESNALSPVATTLADFEAAHYLAGDALLAAAANGPEVAGMFKRAELAGFMAAVRARKAEIEPVPILSAWASRAARSTSVLRRARGAARRRNCARAGPLDAHVPVPARRDGRERRVAIRNRGCSPRRARVLGGAPLVVSHDLHGNVTRARVEYADAIVAIPDEPAPRSRAHRAQGRRARDRHGARRAASRQWRGASCR